jgi:hypothetical protein
LTSPEFSVWALPEALVEFIIQTFFAQKAPGNTALVKGFLPTGQTYAWLYTANHYYQISLDDHEKFRGAACSRGTLYSLELCEFTIEENRPNGDILLNFWRRIGDDSGEGGRALLTQKRSNWVVAQRITGWRSE